MSVIREYIAEIKGVEIFAILSLAIFLLVFTLMVIHAFSIRKREILDYKNIPLDEENIDENENQTKNQ